MALPKIKKQIEARVKDTGDSMSGGLEIKNTGPMFTMTNSTSGQDMRLYPASNSTILLNRNVAGDSSNYRALYLHNSTASSSINNALVFQDTISGTANNYNLLHAGNYNNYAPTKGGTGATGTWGISISGNSASTTLLKPSKNLDTVSYWSSSWSANATGANDYIVWGQSFQSSKLGSDTGDILLWLNNSTALNITIDGEYYATGSKKVLHEGNYTYYVPTKTGSGASGTWGININGNASTATKLATARNIQIGNLSRTFDGSGNISWSLSEIGAAPSSHTHSYLPTGGGSMSGSISFMGSAENPKTPGLNFASETDGANIFFKNESDSDPDGGLYFQISDDTSNANIFMSYKGWDQTDPITFMQFRYGYGLNVINHHYRQNGVLGQLNCVQSSAPSPTNMIWAW